MNRQLAALYLKVPNSGVVWLDEMIRESLRNDFAGMALAGRVTRNPVDVGDTFTSIKLGEEMLARTMEK
jgi:hypothetical protein